MAEAVRKRKPRTKKATQERWLVQEREEDAPGKEEVTKLRHLDANGDDALSEARLVSDIDKEKRLQYIENKDKGVDTDEKAQAQEKSSEPENEKQLLSHTDREDDGGVCDIDTKEEVKLQEYSTTSERCPIAPDFVDLHHQIGRMEPYLEVQKQMKELMIDANEVNPSAPAICCPLENVPSYEVEASAPCLDEEEDDMMNNEAVASAPLLSSPIVDEGTFIEPVEEKAQEAKIFTKTKIELSEDTIVEPMTDIQINSLYQNNELEENEHFIINFLDEERNVSQTEFYELVLNYLRSRTSLIGSQKELSAILDEYRKQKKNIWVFEKRTEREEGECEDGRLLTVKHEYEVACFKEEIMIHVSKQLKQIRELLSDSYALHAYTSEMAKLQVENYMQKILSECPEFMQIPKTAKIRTCGSNKNEAHLEAHVKKLKSCISVLFAFQRRGVKDQQFIRVTRQWLTDLIAILQRVATRTDHLFLLNHVLRCPPGVGSWAPAYIQIGGSWQEDASFGDMFGCWPLDHSLTVLATIMSPVTNREDFLHHLKQDIQAVDEDSSNSTGKESNSDTVWVVVDSSGEEEEDPTQLWAIFTENDVVQLLNQVPFKRIFQHILMIQDEDGSAHYDVSRTSRQGLLKLFAFATCLIQLFQKGLITYAQVRYRGVTKRVCRLLRHTIEYVTNHWQNFLQLHQFSPQHASDMAQAKAHWSALQIEYDQLFEKAVHCIFSSPRSGAWQFLAVIPYGSVSLNRLWKTVYQIHVGWKEDPSKSCDNQAAHARSGEEWADLVSHPDTRGQFHDRLMKIDENEAFYLLTALANMAVERQSFESHFVEVIINNIYEATFINEGTREVLSRIGRDLLATIAVSHSISISYLLTTTQEKISSVGSMALYLFRALPLDIWEPSADDITCVSHWLLFTPVSSIENQLARIILGKLNWGENAKGTELFLPLELHRRVALTVLEAHLKVSREMHQGGILTESVKHVTSVMYAPSHEQVFCDWSWELLTCQHLHKLDQPVLHVQAAMVSPSLLLKDVPDPTSAAITQGSSLHAIKRGLVEKQPLALYLALLHTTWGHSLPEICEHGIDCLHELVVQGRYEAAISAMAHIMPLFFNQPEDITTYTKLIVTVQKCLTADQTYMTLAKSLVTSAFPGRILSLFAGMVVHHIKNYSRYFQSGTAAVRFWQQVLVGIPEWMHDNNVLFLLDTICQHAFIQPLFWHEIMSGFSELMKTSGTSHNGASGFSGLLSWLTSGTAAPNSLQVRSSAPQFPWFTIAVLSLETQGEHSTGLWKNILLELFNDSQATVETALKKVCKDLGLGQVSSSLLSLYRWGQQVIDLPAEHPALPITLQMYFLLHLARVPPQPGQYECTSVINRFYQGFINTQFLNKIKKKITAAVEHHEAKIAIASEDEEELDEMQRGQDEELLKLLRGMQAWMEEIRLYEGAVYLPALPPSLLPKKLMQVFQENWEPWTEAINYKNTEECGRKLLQLWEKHRRGGNICSGSPTSSPSHKGQDGDGTQRSAPHKSPTQAILKRLTTYEAPQPPPPIAPVSPLHLPQVHDNTLLDQDALLYLVQRYTGLVVEHSQNVNLWCSEVCALDCVYREVIPQQWANALTKTILNATCTPPKVGRKQPECSGHASIVVEFSEARLNEGVKVRIDQNREQHDVVLQRCQKPPPLQLCQAAVSLEAIITVLVNKFRETDKKRDEQKWKALLTSGRQLFYHIIQLTSDDTSFYPPAKQLITSCAGLLGEEFIRGHADCQESLVAQVLEWGGKFGGLLAPHFTPAVCPKHTYLILYSTLSPYAPSSPDHTFMLLSKFDIEKWLADTSPNCSERSQLINTIGAAFMSLLPRPDPTLLMVLELYRVHLSSLLAYKFPEHYTEVLNVLLEISASTQEECGGVSSGLWYDLMNLLCVGITSLSSDMDRNALHEAIKEYAQHQTILSQTMVEDTVKMLSKYFVKQRLEFGLYGLYPKYRLHTESIAAFLGLMSHAYIISQLHSKCGTSQEQMVRDVWSGVESLWAGWVTPLGGRDRHSFSPWLRHLTHDIRLLLPWAPSDPSSADTMVSMFAASIAFMHELLPGSSNVLSLTLEYYSAMFAAQEVKSHVLAVVHAHFSGLPWHHLHPSLQDTLTFTKVVEQYLPECHNFIGGILVQINWNKVMQAETSPTSCDSPSETISQGQEVPKSVKLHTCLLNLLVRISMEPGVRQMPLLQTQLQEAESFSWWLVDSGSFQRVVNWWVMSCDPRIVLSLPTRSHVDIAIIQLLHRAAGYTPDTTTFHQDTPAKRGLLVRALVRLLTSAAARHKALLSAKPEVFTSTILSHLTHMENTLTATVPKEQQWSEGNGLSTELLAVVSGGASSAPLQELSSQAVATWLSTQPHPSPGLLLPMVVVASRSILHLNYRNPVLHAGLSALFSHGDWCGWEGEVTWNHLVGLLSFPLTNPTAMLTLAAQEGHLLVVYGYIRWRRYQNGGFNSFMLLTSLFELLNVITPNDTIELGLILIFSEILHLIIQLVRDEDALEALWQHCKAFNSHLAMWAEDRSTTGILAAIGLGRQSPFSLSVRLVCRALSTFLNLQMPREGVFRTHPLHTHSDIDEMQIVKNEACTLEQLRALTTNATYVGVTHSLTKIIQFVEDPTHCIGDANHLLSMLVTDLIPNPLLHHLSSHTAESMYNLPQTQPLDQHPEPEMCLPSASAPPPPPDL